MCDFCKHDSGVDYLIKGKTEISICPNCVAEKICDGSINLPEGEDFMLSEISGHMQSIEIYSHGSDIPYVVDRFEAIRLLGEQLMPNEYNKLLDNHSQYAYELHDNFYSGNGFAYQPLDEGKYVKNLKFYAKDYNDKEALRYANQIEHEHLEYEYDL